MADFLKLSLRTNWGVSENPDNGFNCASARGSTPQLIDIFARVSHEVNYKVRLAPNGLGTQW